MEESLDAGGVDLPVGTAQRGRRSQNGADEVMQQRLQTVCRAGGDRASRFGQGFDEHGGSQG